VATAGRGRLTRRGRLPYRKPQSLNISILLAVPAVQLSLRSGLLREAGHSRSLTVLRSRGWGRHESRRKRGKDKARALRAPLGRGNSKRKVSGQVRIAGDIAELDEILPAHAYNMDSKILAASVVVPVCHECRNGRPHWI